MIRICEGAYEGVETNILGDIGAISYIVVKNQFVEVPKFEPQMVAESGEYLFAFDKSNLIISQASRFRQVFRAILPP